MKVEEIFGAMAAVVVRFRNELVEKGILSLREIPHQVVVHEPAASTRNIQRASTTLNAMDRK